MDCDSSEVTAYPTSNMPPKKKPNLSIEETAIKKSAAAKARLAKIESDPVLSAQHKEKERLNI
nr:unnamed protein product [Callosobruchus analis]